jgi:predicted esterase
MDSRLRYSFLTLVLIGLTLMFSSWNDEEKRAIIGPLPPAPDYTDSTQWFIVNRGGEADLFYIISTETGDHMMGGDTCHLADTYNPTLRKNMLKEMVAVDSFYSGKLNYFSPYYRQVSMHSWASPDSAFVRLPVAVEDVMRSWNYYLEHLNQGRPFIIAGFSQGAAATFDILKNMPDSVRSRLVAAYAIGFKITQEDVDSNMNVKLAQGATDTGVLIGFNSIQSPEAILYISEHNVACINPVNWRTDAEPAPFVLYGRRKNDTLSVHCDTVSHHLIVDGYQQKYIMPVIGKAGNYHHMELKFYYPYIRKNMAERVAAFMREKKEE